MASTKLPSFQFYPGDWLKDPAVRSVSLAARGLWTDMLCLMHESPRRGYLQHATGKPVTAEQLARMTGCSTDEVSRLLQELADAGVFSCTEHGVIYSRRMARDERKRQLCSEAGKRGGGNPRLRSADEELSTFKGDAKGHPKGIPKGQSKGPPKASFSSSSSNGPDGPGNKASSAAEPPLSPQAATPGRRAPPTGVVDAEARITEAWNRLPEPIPRILRWTEKRRKFLRCRLAEANWLEQCLQAISHIAQCPFLLGRNQRAWTANIDWLLRPNSVAKILEGCYDDHRFSGEDGDLDAVLSKALGGEWDDR